MTKETHWWESRRFRFVRLPMAILQDPKYERLSSDARLLYGILFDRTMLSASNGWSDEQGRVFVYYGVKNLGTMLSCGHDKVTRVLRELENAGLLDRKKQGRGKPDCLCVLPFSEVCDISADRSAENQHPGMRVFRAQECAKSAPNHTEKNQTERTHTESFSEVMRGVKEQIGYDGLSSLENAKQVDEIVRLMTEILTGTAGTLRINGENLPLQVVQTRFRELTFDHIQYVLLMLKRNPTPIRRMRAFLLTALYNAPCTMELAIEQMVREDHANLCARQSK